MSSKNVAIEMTDTHYLSTIEWNSMPEVFSYGSLETGIRDVKNGKIVDGSFRLIQHDWNDWESAHIFIKKALSKGWDENRIYYAMEWLKYRKKKQPILF